MIGAIFCVAFVAFSASLVQAQTSCTGAEIKGTVHSVADAAISTHTTIVADLELNCKGGVPASLPLYAEYNGKFYAAAHSKQNPKKYQVSITDETKNFPSSSVSLNIYDEDGYQLARKGGASKTLSTLSHSIRYPYSGPSINSELLVAVFGAAAVYLAYATHAKM